MARCEPAPTSATRANPFPTFPGEPPVAGPLKKSRMGKRRALVLGAIHVAVVVHLLQWKWSGSTLSPVEPSESMRTLELGELNAGFLFFLAAILSTAIFGRFFCGWGCHLVALQDLCGWLMKRAGIRPRPFRSRLLLFAPLVLGLYMFVWPTLKREVLVPLANRAGWSLFREPPPFPGFENHLITQDFWATFPGIAIAIPFLLICGFLTVWLLGAKGFCTYGCPYGGIFGPVDAIAPGRIRVNENCDGCAHCTAVCTSNVRVHAEVRQYGMVRDPGCMKCLDCVDTCPRNALRFGFGAPSLGAASKRPPAPRHWDVSGPAELLLALVFAATFFAWRGAYDAIPFLMAVGLAACTTFVAWLLARLLRRGDVSLQGKVLVESGRWRPAGRVALGAAILLLALGLQTGAVRLFEAAGARADRGVTVGRAEAFAAQRSPLAPDVRAHAERAAARYRLADRIGEGGLGLGSTPSVTARRAWLALVLGDPEEATRQLRRLIARSPERTTVLDLARVRRAAGDAPGAVAVLNGLVAEDPTDTDAHRELAATWMAAGEHAKALAELVIVTNLAPDDRVAAHLRDQLRARVENEPAP